MTIQLTLPPALEKWLTEEAARSGMPIETYAVRLLEQHRPLAPEESTEAERRLRAATTIQEWVEAANALPEEEDDYDLYAALNANRAANGERPLFPPELKGVSW